MDVVRIEEDLNRLIERRARQAAEDRPGQARANDEEERWREKDARYDAAVRLVNARAWAAHYGGLALAAHDQAARYAQKRDEALDLVRALEGEGAS